MRVVREIRQSAGLTQVELATEAGTSQPAVAAYESGAKLPTVRTLRRLAEVAELDLHISVTPKMTREDRRSLWLHRRIAAHLRQDSDLVLGRAWRNLDRMRSLHPGAKPLLDEWDRILRGTVEGIVCVLVSPTPWARELRQVTPFAGVIPPAERASVFREFRRLEGNA